MIKSARLLALALTVVTPLACQPFRFYVWASRVGPGTKAFDYAPDAGWLELDAPP